MKLLVIPALLTLVGSMSMAASQVTVKTLVTCQQDDGDRWVEAGIVRTNKGFELLVVNHDVDDDSATLTKKFL